MACKSLAALEFDDESLKMACRGLHFHRCTGKVHIEG
jgi:hypothetical protein